ncbi:hypothetical protein Dda_6985 [Drechslerella dactyloides]|uniref:Uncharacterized protein n=1 Tax=Drechslerella dactyloides TaxID=74499 RepID=A0AAD6IX98_DREDA|nr:hypothetical protein Dda_6985 [Drechslerella dactyloides]
MSVVSKNKCMDILRRFKKREPLPDGSYHPQDPRSPIGIGREEEDATLTLAELQAKGVFAFSAPHKNAMAAQIHAAGWYTTSLRTDNAIAAIEGIMEAHEMYDYPDDIVKLVWRKKVETWCVGEIRRWKKNGWIRKDGTGYVYEGDHVAFDGDYASPTPKSDAEYISGRINLIVSIIREVISMGGEQELVTKLATEGLNLQPEAYPPPKLDTIANELLDAIFDYLPSITLISVSYANKSLSGAGRKFLRRRHVFRDTQEYERKRRELDPATREIIGSQVEFYKDEQHIRVVSEADWDAPPEMDAVIWKTPNPEEVKSIDICYQMAFESTLKGFFADVLDAITTELEAERRQTKELASKLRTALTLAEMYKNGLENCDSMLRIQQRSNERMKEELEALKILTLPIVKHLPAFNGHKMNECDAAFPEDAAGTAIFDTMSFPIQMSSLTLPESGLCSVNMNIKEQMSEARFKILEQRIGILDQKARMGDYQDINHDVWAFLLLDEKELFRRLDFCTVSELQLRVPGVSTTDALYVDQKMADHTLFSEIESPHIRRQICSRLKRVKVLIPSLNSFFRYIVFLDECANIMRLLTPAGSTMTIFENITSQCRQTNWIQVSETDIQPIVLPDSVGYESNLTRDSGYKQLWLFCMRNFSDMKVAKTSNRRTKSVTDASKTSPVRWRHFATLVQYMGIRATGPVRQHGTDHEMEAALRNWILTNRPLDVFDYSDTDLARSVREIMEKMNRINPRSASISSIDPFLTGYELVPIRERYLIRTQCMNHANGLYMHAMAKEVEDEALMTDISQFFICKDFYRSFFESNFEFCWPREPSSSSESPLYAPLFHQEGAASNEVDMGTVGVGVSPGQDGGSNGGTSEEPGWSQPQADQWLASPLPGFASVETVASPADLAGDQDNSDSLMRDTGAIEQSHHFASESQDYFPTPKTTVSDDIEDVVRASQAQARAEILAAEEAGPSGVAEPQQVNEAHRSWGQGISAGFTDEGGERNVWQESDEERRSQEMRESSGAWERREPLLGSDSDQSDDDRIESDPEDADSSSPRAEQRYWEESTATAAASRTAHATGRGSAAAGAQTPRANPGPPPAAGPSDNSGGSNQSTWNRLPATLRSVFSRASPASTPKAPSQLPPNQLPLAPAKATPQPRTEFCSEWAKSFASISLTIRASIRLGSHTT